MAEEVDDACALTISSSTPHHSIDYESRLIPDESQLGAHAHLPILPPIKFGSVTLDTRRDSEPISGSSISPISLGIGNSDLAPPNDGLRRRSSKRSTACITCRNSRKSGTVITACVLWAWCFNMIKPSYLKPECSVNRYANRQATSAKAAVNVGGFVFNVN